MNVLKGFFQGAFLAGCVVIAAGCVSSGKYKKEVAKDEQLTALNQQLSAELSADEAKIQQYEDELKVTVLDNVLFASGGHTINATGKATLDKIAPSLASLDGPRVVVEAFTDNVPIGPHLKARYPTNMDLSSARANEVVRYLASKGVPMEIMSAQGFGESHPVAGNDTPEGRAQNRRVEIVVKNTPID